MLTGTVRHSSGNTLLPVSSRASGRNQVAISDLKKFYGQADTSVKVQLLPFPLQRACIITEFDQEQIFAYLEIGAIQQT